MKRTFQPSNLVHASATAFVRAWPRLAVVVFSRRVVPKVASVSALDHGRLCREPEHFFIAAIFSPRLAMAIPVAASLIMQVRDRRDDEAPRLGPTATRKIGNAVTRQPGPQANARRRQPAARPTRPSRP